MMFSWVIDFCHYGMNSRIFEIISAYSIGYQLILPCTKERVREVNSSISIQLDPINVETFQGTVNAGKTIVVI
jgi:hypothetical protein